MSINGKCVVITDKVSVAEKIVSALHEINFEKKEYFYQSDKIFIICFWGFSKTIEEQSEKISLVCKDTDLIINAMPTGNLLLEELFIAFLTQFKISKPVKIISTVSLNEKALASEFERVSTSIIPVNVNKAEEAFSRYIEERYGKV